jgi:hypothetical protein
VLSDGMQVNGYWTELEARLMETMALFYLQENPDGWRSRERFESWLKLVDSEVACNDRYVSRMWAHVRTNAGTNWRKGA